MLHGRGEREQLSVYGAHLRAPRARKPRERRIRRTVCLRVDEVQNTFSLLVGDLSVEERSLSELSAARKPRSRREARLENAPRRYRPAVALELDNVLAGVGMRTLEGDDHGGVD